MKTILATLCAVLVLSAAAAGAWIWWGFYDVAATEQHLPPTYWAIDKTMLRSIARRAAQIRVPTLDTPEQIAQGLSLYRAHCVQCHGAPGKAPEPFALGLLPLPAPLAQTGRDWPPAHVFWVVKYGIKMTGMPAWAFRMTDEEIWAIVAFVRRLPMLTPENYRALPEGPTAAAATRLEVAAPNPQRGKVALQQYACAGCHRIPGITGSDAQVGPPLGGIATRAFLGGVLPNSPENLVRWIRAPQSVTPLTAMPDLGVTERDARDIASYLATLQ